jgi:hypothetical protein
VSRSRVVAITLACVAAFAVVVVWILHVRAVTDWLEVHTGTVNEAGPYYGFWSGFGSDLAEFGILGALATAVYHLVRKWNCHEPGCWRIGRHSAAGGQFMLCYKHHPDYQGTHPTHEMIERLHREQKERAAAVSNRLDELHAHLVHDHGVSPGAAPPSAAAPPTD